MNLHSGLCRFYAVWLCESARVFNFFALPCLQVNVRTPNCTTFVLSPHGCAHLNALVCAPCVDQSQSMPMEICTPCMGVKRGPSVVRPRRGHTASVSWSITPHPHSHVDTHKTRFCEQSHTWLCSAVYLLINEAPLTASRLDSSSLRAPPALAVCARYLRTFAPSRAACAPPARAACHRLAL